MIYIFEDRPGRKLQHQKMIDKYKSIIRFDKFDIDEGMNLADYIHNNFSDAEIVIIHKSYSFKSKTVNLDEIRKKMPDVRFVIFSGGIEYGSISEDRNTVTINADVMYDNLESFILESFIKNYDPENVKFEILVWGEQYRLNQLLSFQARIFSEFFINSDLQAPIDDIKDSIDVISSLGKEYNITISEIDLPIKPVLTWGDLLQIIREHIAMQEK